MRSRAEGVAAALYCMVILATDALYIPPPYCPAGFSIVSEEVYDQPSCGTQSAQPPFNSSVEYAAYRIDNLTFCCKSPYTALLPAGTDLAMKDLEAQTLFDQGRKMMIERYDCSGFYPFHTCDPCLEAYRTWICATLFPMKCQNDNTAVKICRDVCLEVIRKCPPEFGFLCPDDNTEYMNGKGGCNMMHYNDTGNSAGGTSGIVSTLAFGIFSVVLLLLAI